MNLFTAVVLYVLIWWVVLFAVLPFGPKPDLEPDKLTGWRGARPNPMIGRKVIATTLFSLVIWAGAYVLISGPWLSFRAGGFFALPGK